MIKSLKTVSDDPMTNLGSPKAAKLHPFVTCVCNSLFFPRLLAAHLRAMRQIETNESQTETFLDVCRNCEQFV